jgi:glutamate dehydrogenase (NADP+)
MSQNSLRLSWSAEEVDKRNCASYSRSCVQYGRCNWIRRLRKRSNIAGFVKVADAMLAQGVVYN